LSSFITTSSQNYAIKVSTSLSNKQLQPIAWISFLLLAYATKEEAPEGQSNIVLYLFKEVTPLMPNIKRYSSGIRP
jgi:hypothetical protein